MRRFAETVVFLAIACAIHLGLAWRGPEAGGNKGGEAGTEYVSLAGAPPQIETVLEDWTRPPEHQVEVIEQPDTPEIQEIEAPLAPALEIDVSPKAAVKVAALLPTERPKAPDLQSVQTPLAPPPDATPPVRDIAVPVPPKPVELPKPRQDAEPLTRSTQAPSTPQPVPETSLPTPEPPPPPKPDEPEPKPEPKPKPKPKKQAQKSDKAQKAVAGAQAQKAAGTSGGKEAGSKGTTKALGQGQVKKHMAVWQAKIVSRIERNKRAPRGAKSKGTVRLRIKVAPSGQLLGVSVAKSSGVAALDQAAVQAVKRSKRFAKAHKSLNKSAYGFSFRVVFK